jgi:hypothetical protein
VVDDVDVVGAARRGVRWSALVADAPSAELRLERFAGVEADADSRFPLAVVPRPQGSYATGKAPGAVYRPVRLALAPDGRPHLLGEDGARRVLAAFDAAGSELAQTELPAPDDPARTAILDFAVGAGGAIYLLERVAEGDGTLNRLSKLSDGRVVWTTSGPGTGALDLERLAGPVEKLLVDGAGGVYVTAPRTHGSVARLDEDGRPHLYADWGDYRGDAFMNTAGTIFYVQFVPQTGRRYWVALDPATKATNPTPVGAEAFEFLAGVIGADDAARAYGTAGWAVASVDTDGSVAWRVRFEGLAVGPDGALHTSTAQGGSELEVRRWADGAEDAPVRLVLPPSLDGSGGWRLLRVEPGRYVFYGGETPRTDGVLVSFSSDGTVEDVVDPASPDVLLSGWSLQSPQTWRVGLDGSVYAVALGPGRVELLRLRSA